MNLDCIDVEKMSDEEKIELRERCLLILSSLNKEKDDSKLNRSFKASSKVCPACGRAF